MRRQMLDMDLYMSQTIMLTPARNNLLFCSMPPEIHGIGNSCAKPSKGTTQCHVVQHQLSIVPRGN